MGHLTVLVIGDDFRDQLLKYESNDHVAERHRVNIDLMDGVRRHFGPAYNANNDALLDWISRNDVPIIGLGEVADQSGRHRDGWARIGPDRRVHELVQRTDPPAFHMGFECTLQCLLLKPGAAGESIDITDGHKTTVDAGPMTGRARKRDIDFEAVRGPRQARASERWERAQAACRGERWIPYRTIYDQLKGTEHYLALAASAATEWRSRIVSMAALVRQDSSSATTLEWFQALAIDATARWRVQPAVDAIIASARRDSSSHVPEEHWDVGPNDNWWNPQVIGSVDSMLEARADYVAGFGVGASLGCAVVIAKGERFDEMSEPQLAASIDAVADDEWFTVAYVYA